MAIHEFFLMLAVLLLTARLFGELASRLGAPSVIGELLAGLVLGPSVLGWVQPTETLMTLAEVGIILLLFEVGLDTNLFRLAEAGRKPFVVAAVGAFLPLVLGFAAGWLLFDTSILAALFIGGTLTATSIGITVRVLDDLMRRRSDEAQIVIGAAVIDDILGVIILAFLYDFSSPKGVSLASTASIALFIVVFMVLAPIAGKIIAWAIDHTDRKLESEGLLITLVISLIMLFSWLAHAVGAPAIMGGFAAGIALSQHFRMSITQRLRLPFRRTLERAFASRPELTHRLEKQFRPLLHTYTPIFFVMVGVSLDLSAVDWSSARVWLMAGVLVVLAVAGKVASGWFIAEPTLRRAAIGLSMVPRGEVGLIFAKLGLGAAILSQELYAVLLIVVALSTLLPPFALKAFYQRYGDRPELVMRDDD
ncbi:MAG: cation:proton antiporter [Proteobacteria bacterium]|nr:cation:proton antiporter [Pseudomonadota bacterium]